VAGLLAGFLAQKGFDLIWSKFDEEEAPEPDLGVEVSPFTFQRLLPG
jgi:hypothetical protein